VISSRDINDIQINISNCIEHAITKYDANNIFCLGQSNLLCKMGIRTFAWRIYLGILNPNGTIIDWMRTIYQDRQDFQKLWKEYENVY
jgi:hypothetical protein